MAEYDLTPVSDASPLAGLAPGEYTWHGTALVSAPSGRIALKNGSALAGSSATMADCLAWLQAMLGLSKAECRRVGRTNPLRVIGWQ